MNKKSAIKTFEEDRDFTVIGQETKDASGVFVFYSLLLESLAHFGHICGVEGIPDVSSTQTTYLVSGQREVPGKFVEIAQFPNASAHVGTFFSLNLIPNMAKTSVSIAMDAVLTIIEEDDSIGKATQRTFKKWHKEKAPADFLAEAFIVAVRSGKNKIDDSMEAASDFSGLLDTIKDIEAKLDKLPVPQALTPPDKQEGHERVYIGALLEAYDDASDVEPPPSEDITQHPKFEKDLKQRRIEYFAAEAVRRGTRESFRQDDPDNLFAMLKEETFNGVVDVHGMDYRHGFERLQKVMAHATTLQLDNCLLARIPNWVGTSQKKGVCHMLVNDGQIKGWVDDNE
jgi:hypothetical protein